MLDHEFDRATGNLASRDDELGHRDGKLEPTRTGASRVDEKNAIAFGHGRLVRVAEDDGPDSGPAGLDVQLLDVVDHIDEDLLEADQLGLAQTAGPRALVVVASDGCHGCECRQFPKNGRTRDVASVHDVVAAAQEGHRLRAQQVVRVRYETYAKHVLPSAT